MIYLLAFLFLIRTQKIVTRETAFAAFSCGSSNVNVLGIDAINWKLVGENLYIPSAIIYVVLTVIVYGISFWIYISANKKYIYLEKMDDETFENEIPDVELALSKSMIIGAVMFLFSFLMFPVVILCREAAEMAGKELALTGISDC